MENMLKTPEVVDMSDDEFRPFATVHSDEMELVDVFDGVDLSNVVPGVKWDLELDGLDADGYSAVFPVGDYWDRYDY